MMNRDVDMVVNLAVGGIEYASVAERRDVGGLECAAIALRRSVYWAVGEIVYGVVNWAVYEAVAQPEESLHPGLGLYLGVVG